MESSTLAIAASTCQCLTIVCSLSAYIPQWVTLYRRKSSDDISLKSWVLWIGCALLGTFYSVTIYLTHGVGLALVFTDIAALCFISVTIGMILKYRRANRAIDPDLLRPIAAIADTADAISRVSGEITEGGALSISESTAARTEARPH